MQKKPDMRYILIWMSDYIYPAMKEKHSERVLIQDPVPFLFCLPSCPILKWGIWRFTKPSVIKLHCAFQWSAALTSSLPACKYGRLTQKMAMALFVGAGSDILSGFLDTCLQKKQQTPWAPQSKPKHRGSYNWMTASVNTVSRPQRGGWSPGPCCLAPALHLVESSIRWTKARVTALVTQVLPWLGLRR